MTSILAYRNPQKSYLGREQVAESGSYHYQGNRPLFKSTKLDVSHLQGTEVGSLNPQHRPLQIMKNSKTPCAVALPAKPSRVVGKDNLKAACKKPILSFKAYARLIQLSSTNMKVLGKEAKSQNFNASGASATTSCHPMPSSHPLEKVRKEISESEYLPGGNRGLHGFSSSKSRVLTDRSARLEPKSSTQKNKILEGESKHKVQERNATSGEVHKDVCLENVVKVQYKLSQVNRDKRGGGSEFMELRKSKAALKMARAGFRDLELNLTAGVSPASGSSSVSGSQYKVLEALKQFEKLYLQLRREENQGLKGRAYATARNCIKAAMILRREGKWINTDQNIGNVSGIEIGAKFQFRAELAVVGLHHQLFRGISYARFGSKTYAISIVNSGRYENVTKSSDVFIYTGEGGNPNVTNKKPRDQKMVMGNLALKNNMVDNFPVRVIHCRKTLKAFDTLGINNGKGLAYVYDGLYTVVGCWEVRDQLGKLAFKFEMKRLVE
ncbi:histone-lysine N-methyltransferase, H3 lysine-9 specific SUVH5-like [Coffea eugenioides]|uniref:histone-lysine N-methyltransferase, H3 lysine-9 specific SUVH5-like n=1 Tax=Coffea eugenioides TaxID=49369 RepID=UPI000F612590|nr:histone-lysine N-methyltransferase, H3 lysine-9 specific SUVH5-like [Coffea eugenioides]